MSAPIVQELQQAIDAKYAEAVKALKTLQTYLEQPVSPLTGSKGTAKVSGKKPKKAKTPPSRAGTGKIRPAVLAEMRKDFQSIRAVAERTGLTTLQVRGVVLAPALKERFAKQEVDGVMQYKYEDEKA